MLSLYEEIQASEYASQLDKIMGLASADIDGTFLGFTDTYKHLAKIIPLEYEVYDFGCAYNFQAYYFRYHKAYHAVNPPHNGVELFTTENTIYYPLTTGEFLKDFTPPPNSFAIVNYVPNWHDENSMELVKSVFSNSYTFYPTVLDKPKLKRPS